MTLYMVRHADAKSRAGWTADDGLRPLSKRGERQAVAIAGLLASDDVRRVVSSPAVRCVDTVAPLAGAAGVAVEVNPALAEGAEAKVAYDLLVETAGRKGDSVLCMHGDLIPEMLRRLAKDGVALDGGDRWAKGSTWVLSVDHGRPTSGRYVAPPA